MNIAAVRLFLEVVEAGSLSKVAAHRQTAQSHISRQITDFEAGYGGPLFRRTGRGVVVTELGARVAARLRPWLQETEQMALELKSDSGRIVGRVTLGIIPTAAHPLTTRLFERLQREHPGISLDLVEAQGTELDALLDSRSLDLAVLFRFSKPSGREEKLLSSVSTYLVSAPGDALTRQPTLAFSRLKGLRLVLPRRPSHWRNALDETARGLGFQLEAVAEADSLTVQRTLVATQPGLYSILGPYSFAEDLHAGRVQATKLVRPDLMRYVTLATPRHGKLTPACKVAAQTIQALVKSWGNQLSEP
ncbi:LysR family transcriptional regulator [Roseateles sp.]|uniref:LysR family transcriptional regulator n=1 Tax=Roseateles sp. TaxID=1971397 RepID=UPI0031E02E29